MAPSKASRAANDDSKAEPSSNSKEKTGSMGGQSNGKLRRVASSTGSSLRDREPPTPATEAGPASQDSSAKSRAVSHIEWPALDRDFLHAYRRLHQLHTPTAFSREYHKWILTQRGGIGLFSPTMTRRKGFRRQTRDQLSAVAHRHFNGLEAQENNTIVDFIHKVRSQGLSRAGTRIDLNVDHVQADLER